MTSVIQLKYNYHLKCDIIKPIKVNKQYQNYMYIRC
uniref:Uncharacterized protein n=1 Tax=Arundo donax TaxID=35708 RepID=A0A0A9GBF1_ARUDO